MLLGGDYLSKTMSIVRLVAFMRVSSSNITIKARFLCTAVFSKLLLLEHLCPLH